MEDDKVIGSFIRELREEMNLSQEQLANKISIDRTVFNKWENGKVSVPSAHLKSLATVFGVSVDEILVGERMTLENKDKFANIHLDLIDKNRKIKRIINILSFILGFVLLIFFGYYYVSNYNSIQVYRISSESDLFTINNGLFIKARDKVYFELNNTYLSDDEIDVVRICYEENRDKRCLLETSDLYKISFVDYYGYEEYISFESINEIMNNMYIELVFKDGEEKIDKLIFTKDYANTNYFINEKEKIGNDASNELGIDISDIDSLNNRFIEYVQIVGSSSFNYEFNDISYKISYDGISLLIDFFEENKEFIIAYSYNGSKIFQVDLCDNYEFVETVCLFSFSDNECLNDGCEENKRFISIYLEIISSFLDSVDFSISN